MERESKTPSTPAAGWRILLLTPYTGGNLGDAAIQDAIIHHFRKRLFEPQLTLVTLAPGVTGKLHGLPSFPIASSSSGETPAAPADHLPQNNCRPARGGFLAGIKERLRQTPWLYPMLSSVARGLRAVGAFPRRAGAELRHWFQAHRLLKQTDLLVMSGGGQIDDYWGGPFGQPYALFKWALLARLAGTPVAFPSVGVCSLASCLSRGFARVALRLAAYRSYRDPGSKQLLAAAAFTHTDPEYPDLAFSHPAAVPPTFSPGDSNPVCSVIGISPMVYLSSHGWPERDTMVYERYLETLGAFAGKLLDAGHIVVLFTSSLMDRFAVNDLQAKLRHSPGAWDGRLRQLEQQGLAAQLDEIRKMDLVVASRLHGIILSHLLGKPALAISYDRKVRAHMETMAQERFCLDLRSGTLPQLWDGFVRLGAESSAISTGLLSKVKECGQKLDLQYDLLVHLLAQPHCARKPDPAVAAG